MGTISELDRKTFWRLLRDLLDLVEIPPPSPRLRALKMIVAKQVTPEMVRYVGSAKREEKGIRDIAARLHALATQIGLPTDSSPLLKITEVDDRGEYRELCKEDAPWLHTVDALASDIRAAMAARAPDSQSHSTTSPVNAKSANLPRCPIEIVGDGTIKVYGKIKRPGRAMLPVFEAMVERFPRRSKWAVIAAPTTSQGLLRRLVERDKEIKRAVVMSGREAAGYALRPWQRKSF